MRVAVIGAGYWGRNLIRVFAEIGVLAVVCDVNADVATRLAAEYGATARSIEYVLGEPTIDAVAIATPAVEHAALALRALNRGKHVFVEKPMALRVEDAEYLLKVAQEQNLTLMVGHLLQYHPAFLKLKELIAGGVIGIPEYFYSNRLNLGKIRREEDILWSFAPHDISMILSLVGEEPSSVSTIGSSFLSPPIADVTLTHLTFPSGVRGHIFVSWLHPFKEQRLIAIGSEGMIAFDDGLVSPEKVRLYRHSIEWVDDIPAPVKSDGESIEILDSEPLRLELEHFCECVATGATPRTNGEEGIRVLRVLQLATESMLEENSARWQ